MIRDVIIIYEIIISRTRGPRNSDFVTNAPPVTGGKRPL